jgi:hypothetical protein
LSVVSESFVRQVLKSPQLVQDMETDDRLGSQNVDGNPTDTEQGRRPPALDLDKYPVEVLEAVLRILKAQERESRKPEPGHPR